MKSIAPTLGSFLKTASYTVHTVCVSLSKYGTTLDPSNSGWSPRPSSTCRASSLLSTGPVALLPVVCSYRPGSSTQALGRRLFPCCYGSRQPSPLKPPGSCRLLGGRWFEGLRTQKSSKHQVCLYFPILGLILLLNVFFFQM